MAEQALKQTITVPAKPILKWAGGKTQLLGICFKSAVLLRKIYRAVFWWRCNVFALQPERAVIADSNPELINLYRQVAYHVDDVIYQLKI